MVLVIIGLIVGGVLVGQTLVKGAEVRATVSQIEKYNQAVNAFQGKYNCLPGDCSNATNFFGTFAVLPTNSQNGDGNGMILDSHQNAANMYPFDTANEVIVVFSHLFLAGLTDCCNPANLSPVFYGGAPGPAGAAWPATKAGQGGFVAVNIESRNGWFLGMGNAVPASACGGGNNNDHMNLQAGGKCINSGGLLTPQQAWAFDTKVDDGLPTTGNVVVAWVYGGDNHVHPVTIYWAGFNCIANTTPPSYNVSYGSPVCNLFARWQ